MGKELGGGGAEMMGIFGRAKYRLTQMPITPANCTEHISIWTPEFYHRNLSTQALFPFLLVK